MQGFGERLVKLLKEKNMTQKELAKKADVTEAAISQYINGNRNPRGKVMARIANALGTTTDYLVEGTPLSKKDDLDYAKRLIARNVSQMSKEEKIEIAKILLGDED